VEVGPSVLRYKIKLAPGEEAGKLRRQAENIARQLAATSIPIIGFLPGTNFEYLDLARPDRQLVLLEPLLTRTNLKDMNELPLHIGVNPAGQPTRLDLGDDKLPHILVAGGTGSGKTIFLYSVVLSLVSAHSDKTLELVIIDPKQTDFTVYANLPHLRDSEVITDADRGVEVVRGIADHDMQQRSDQLQKAKCRDIKTYNVAHPKKPIRPLVVVIDEYADLVAVLGKKDKEDFERVISRITARGRNVGIHLILATQRPTADIVTGNIKANMACRISFSLPSSRDSQVVLDEPGAERLLRNGDMLLLLEGKLTRLQGYYVDPTRIEGLLRTR
jgi:DNA segregation ATPase FtsK/SpoIIIE-like protein